MIDLEPEDYDTNDPIGRLSLEYNKRLGPWEWIQDDERSIWLLISILFGAGVLGSLAGYVLAFLAPML